MNTNFLCKKISDLDGYTKVVWHQESSLENPFTVTASPLGITMKGELEGYASDDEEMTAIAKVFATAWEMYRHSLKPKIDLRGV